MFAPFDFGAQRLHAAERRLAIGASRIVVDLRCPLRQRGENSVAMGDRLVAWQADIALKPVGRRNRFWHGETSIVSSGSGPRADARGSVSGVAHAVRWSNPEAHCSTSLLHKPGRG